MKSNWKKKMIVLFVILFGLIICDGKAYATEQYDNEQVDIVKDNEEWNYGIEGQRVWISDYTGEDKNLVISEKSFDLNTQVQYLRIDIPKDRNIETITVEGNIYKLEVNLNGMNINKLEVDTNGFATLMNITVNDLSLKYDMCEYYENLYAKNVNLTCRRVLKIGSDGFWNNIENLTISNFYYKFGDEDYSKLEIIDADMKNVNIDGYCNEICLSASHMPEKLNINECGTLTISGDDYALGSVNINDCESLIIDGNYNIGNITYNKINNATIRNNDIENIDFKTIKSLNLQDCWNVKSLNLPSCLKELTINSLGYIEKIEVPESVENLFIKNIPSLREINIPNETKRLEISETSVKEIIVPETVIELRMLWKNSELERVIIRSECDIPESCMKECAKLKNVELNSNTKSLPKDCFTNDSELETVDGMNNIKEINENAFYGCTQLKNISILNCTYIGNSAFCGCRELNIHIPDKCEFIGGGAFSESGIEIYSLPKELKTLGGSAFSNCNNITKITSMGKIKKLDGAFCHCPNLTLIVLPDTLEEMGTHVFEGDSNLEYVINLSKNTTYTDKTFWGTNLHCIYGYSGSTTEELQNQAMWLNSYLKQYLQFIPIDNSGLFTDIPSADYIITIFDENDMPVQYLDVNVYTDDYAISYEVTSNEQGIIHFKNPNEQDWIQDVEYVNLSFTYNNKEYTIKHNLKSNNRGFLYLSRNEYIPTSVLANGHDVLVGSKTINIKAIDKITFDFEILSEEEVVFKIFDGKKELASTTSVSIGQIEIETKDINNESKLYLNVYDKSGTKLASKRLKISFWSIPIIGNNIGELKLGIGKAEFTFSDLLGPLSGLNINIDIPELINKIAGRETNNKTFELVTEVDDEKVKIGFNVGNNLNKDKQTSLRELQQKFGINWLEKMANSGGGKLGDDKISLGGFAELTFDNGVLYENTNEVFGSISTKIEKSVPYHLWGLPAILKFEFAPKGEIRGQFKYNSEGALTTFKDFTNIHVDGDTSIGSDVTLKTGLGVEDGSLGVYGKMSVILKFKHLLQPDTVEITGSAGIYGEILGQEVNYPIILNDRKVVGDFNNIGNNSKNFWSVENIDPAWYIPLSNTKSIYNIKAYNHIPNYTYQSLANWSYNSNDNGKKLLATDLYTFAKPSIITAGEDTIMLIIDNDYLRDDYNYKTLKYSVYNNGTWSEVKQVDSNNTADNDYSYYTDGNNLYIIYTEEKELMEKSNTMVDYAQKQEISVAKWNKDTKCFDNISTLTNNDTYDRLPKISIVGNVPVAVWINNSSNDPFGLEGTNTVMYSKFENDQWSEAKEIKTKDTVITGCAFGKIGENSYIAIVSDKDNDLINTQNDKVIEIINLEGESKTLSEGDISNIKFINYKSNILTWYGDNNINYVESESSEIKKFFDFEDEDLNSNYIIKKNDSKLYVIYTLPREDDTEGIYEIIGDESGKFGEPILIINTDDRITSFGADYAGDELIVAYVNTIINTQENGNITKNSSLYFDNIKDGYDIELSNVEIEKEDIIPNTNQDINIYVKNNGQKKVTSFDVQIIDSENNEVYSDNIQKEIIPGKIEQITLSDIPIENVNYYSIKVENLDYEENNIENNEKTLWIAYTDLSLELSNIEQVTGNFVYAEIINNGYFDAENVTLNIVKNDEVVYTKDIETVCANTSTFTTILIKDEYFEEGRNTLKFEVTTSSQKLYPYDIKNTILINNFEEEELEEELEEEVIFPDVNKSDWFYSYVEYVYKNGLMNGYTAGDVAGTFGPEDSITRGQIVTILYRMEGKPNVDFEIKFKDMENPEEYYYDPVRWAAENKIVTGYLAGENAGNFMPNNPITREELAIILRRYALLKGKNVEKTADLSRFSDYQFVSDWAEEGLKWAVSVGIITGNKDTEIPTIKPQGNATRAEAATMIMRYCENL